MINSCALRGATAFIATTCGNCSARCPPSSKAMLFAEQIVERALEHVIGELRVWNHAIVDLPYQSGERICHSSRSTPRVVVDAPAARDARHPHSDLYVNRAIHHSDSYGKELASAQHQADRKSQCRNESEAGFLSQVLQRVTQTR
jgi:hypothetical protein